MSTHARTLAERLAAAGDEDLVRLFTARGVRADAVWHDFFDAAEALLDPASIARALPSLTTAEAEALHRAARTGSGAQPDGRAALLDLALLREDGTVPAEVAAVVVDRPAPPPLSGGEPLPASEEEAAHAAERGLTTLAQLADLLMLTKETPLALLTGGRLSAGERRRLDDAGIPADDADALVSLAVAAGLATISDRHLHATAMTEDWLRSSAADRWRMLATAFRDALPRGARTAAGGWITTADWPFAHPWDPAWPTHSAELLRGARLLGLVADGGAEPPWARSLRNGEAADPTSLVALLPAEVDRIFLQNDLTAIAPGPLAPALDVRLRTMARRESATQASSYRFTAESVAHAFLAGETAESIREFLGALSLTGIPQPLDYLVAQTAQRHGLVRVSVDDETGRTRIESADPHLIEAMAVDQALRPLALTAHVASLTTRVRREVVYAALLDARYPATLVGADDRALADRRRAPLPAATDSPDGDLRPLITSLRAHQGPDADAAWLDRELESAVRARAVLHVVVGMPDGSTRELTLEATGMGGGRLRGRDRAADVERTLPVSSIRSATIVTA